MRLGAYYIHKHMKILNPRTKWTCAKGYSKVLNKITITIKGVVEQGSQTKGQGMSGQRPKKKKWPHQFWWWKWSLMCPKELWICFGWFSWSSRCIWVAVVTVLAVGESGRAIWTHWDPLNLSSEDGKKMVKKLSYNKKEGCFPMTFLGHFEALGLPLPISCPSLAAYLSTYQFHICPWFFFFSTTPRCARMVFSFFVWLCALTYKNWDIKTTEDISFTLLGCAALFASRWFAASFFCFVNFHSNI